MKYDCMWIWLLYNMWASLTSAHFFLLVYVCTSLYINLRTNNNNQMTFQIRECNITLCFFFTAQFFNIHQFYSLSHPRNVYLYYYNLLLVQLKALFYFIFAAIINSHFSLEIKGCAWNIYLTTIFLTTAFILEKVIS